MGSKKAELHQKSVGMERKKLDARGFKALFKRQRIKEGLPDVDGKPEGPDNMSHICNGNGRVISSKSIGGEDVSDECCKRLKGNLRHLSIHKASGGDLHKLIGNLRRADAEILGNNVTVDSNYIDDVVSNSPKPLTADSLTDPKTDSSTRKNVDGFERLPKECSITKKMKTSKSRSADCMARPQQVDPSIVQGELTELQGTQVTSSNEGISTITASNLTESLQIDSISTNDTPNSMSGRSSFGAEVGTGEPEQRFPSLSEQNNHHNFLRVELRKLFQLLKLSEDVTHRVREFLEHVIQNHDVSGDSPAIMQAFQLSMSLENAFDSGKDCMLADEDSSKVPSHIIDGAPLFSLFKENNVKVEIEEIVENILKWKLGMHVKAAGSEILDKVKKIWKKIDKPMKKLDKKNEEVQGLLRIWEEEKVKLEKDHKLESVVTRFLHGEGSVRTSKLKLLDDKFAKKMEEHNLLKDMQLNSLKEKQLAARNEASQKAADWLAEAIACASKLGTVNGPQSFGSQSENGPECTESGTHIMGTGPENVVTMFEERAEDPNPIKNLCPTELTRPVSDDIILCVDSMETNNTSNIGDSMGPLIHSEEMPAFPDRCGFLKQHVSQDEIQVMASADLEDRDTSAAEIQNTSQIEVATSELGDAVTLVQSNHAVPVAGNGEQLNQFSVDASLICNKYPPHEIEHQNRDQGTNFSQTVVAGENEKFSHEFVSQGSENLHHNHLDLGQQACRISHEQNAGFVRFPDNTIMSEAVSTTELPNQSVPQLGIDGGHLRGPRNNDAEMTRSTCVQVPQNEIHPVASAELENQGTPAAEIRNTSQTEVQSDAVTLVQSNHPVPVTGNYEQLHHFSVDASLICNQSPPNEIEHQSRDQITNFSRTVAAGETEEFSHEFVSRSSENLHHNHPSMGEASRISHEQSVEVFVCSPDNTVMAEAVSTTELPNQSVPQLGIDAVHLRGPGHLFVHPTHPVTSWNSTPSLVAEPLQNELEKLWKEAERLEKIHENAASQLKSDCGKKIQEIIYQIRTKYDMKLKDAEAEFRLKKNELEKNKNLVLMNSRLAEGFRFKYEFRPLQLQQVFLPSFEQHLQQALLPPPMRISSLASASRPPPSQQTLAPSAQALNQLYMPTSVRSSPVAIRNVSASPPVQAIQRAGSAYQALQQDPR